MKRLSLRKKLLFSFISTLTFLAIVEFSLALVGFTPVVKFDDPFVGFSKQFSLFEGSVDANGQEILSTAKSKLVWFNEQTFPRRKSPNTFRVFCLGGSTTYGHPYWDPTSYSRWLREFLPIVDPSKHFEVINAGGISYASYRVANVLEELAQYEPDLFIVYSVHNEFLERRTYAAMFDRSQLSLRIHSLLAKTRTWAWMERMLIGNREDKKTPDDSQSKGNILPAEVDEILNHTIGPVDYHRDDEWKVKVLKHYEFNLNRMVDIAKRSQAKIVFLTPASNEKNCSPFKSEADSRVIESDQQVLQSLLRRASIEADDDDAEKAIQLLEKALRIDEHYAEIHYRIGQSLLSLKRFDEAMFSFRRALNEDICPLRAVDGIADAIRRVGIQQHVPIIDFEARLRAICRKQLGHASFGEEYFLDHVHPTVEVHQQLARWIIHDLQEHHIVSGKPLSDPGFDREIANVIEKIYSEIDNRAYGIALRNLAKVLHWAGKFEEAEPRARDALDRIPNDPESRFVLADCLRNTGRSQEAIDEYDRLFDSGVEFDRAYHPFGDLLAKQGEYTRAKAYLILAAVREPQNALVYYTLGVVHLQLGEYDFAVESLAESDRLSPNNLWTWYFLAQAKFGNNELTDAIALFENLLDRDFDPVSVHFALGMLFFEQDDMTKAIEHLESAVKLDPTFEEAIKYLELARAK